MQASRCFCCAQLPAETTRLRLGYCHACDPGLESFCRDEDGPWLLCSPVEFHGAVVMFHGALKFEDGGGGSDGAGGR